MWGGVRANDLARRRAWKALSGSRRGRTTKTMAQIVGKTTKPWEANMANSEIDEGISLVVLAVPFFGACSESNKAKRHCPGQLITSLPIRREAICPASARKVY